MLTPSATPPSITPDKDEGLGARVPKNLLFIRIYVYVFFNSRRETTAYQIKREILSVLRPEASLDT